MSDSIFMPLAQRASGRRELTGWEALWMPLGEGEAERLTIGRGAGWKPIEVPRQLAAQEGRQSVWYRTEFPRPDHAGRVVLRIGGAFLATNVWLNGKLLGAHYGYFAPFGFDLTPYLKPENLLVICCESPVETQPENKRHIMGLFNDGDLKPYPASAYSSLPDPYRIEVPLGLWQPVQLEYVGPIAMDWIRITPGFEGGDGRLEVEARLRNLDGRQMDGEVELVVPAPGRHALRLRREVALGRGMGPTSVCSGQRLAVTPGITVVPADDAKVATGYDLAFSDSVGVPADPGAPCVAIKPPQDLEREGGLNRGNIFHAGPSWFFAEDEVQEGRWGTETTAPWRCSYAVAWSGSALISSTDRFERLMPSGVSRRSRRQSSHGAPESTSTAYPAVR